MSQVTVTPHHARTCAGCLGNGACWVCLGTGHIQRDFQRRVTCNRCQGTGICAEELHHVISLPDQRQDRAAV